MDTFEDVRNLRLNNLIPGGDTLREIPRTLAIESADLQESAYDPSKGVLTVTVIKPGFSRNKTKLKESGKSLQRYYPAETLKRDHKVFDGAKMFADHQTEAEAKDHPGGSVSNWVASLGNTWVESDGTVKASAVVVDPQFKAKLDALKQNGLLKEMKTSVRIAAGISEGEAEGKTAAIIESILGSRSVDFVTQAGAGGQVEAMESEAQLDLDIVSEADLRERRPDLVELIESRTHTTTTIPIPNKEQQVMTAEEIKAMQDENTKLKDVNTKLQESAAVISQKKLDGLETENKKLIAENEELKTGQMKRDAAAKLGEMLKESKLPEPAQKRLQERFKDATSEEDFKEAIGEEKEYIKSIGGKAEVKHLGEKHNSVSDNVNHRDELIESFLGMGLTKEQAEIAASGRRH